MRRELDRHRLGQALDGVFRRAVDAARRRADMAHLRRHVDDRAAAALCDHLAGDRLGDEKRRFDVEVDHFVVIFLRHLDKGLRRVGAGVVHEDVDAVEPADFLRDFGKVHHVADQCCGTAAGLAGLAGLAGDLRRNGVEFRPGAADQDHVGPGAGQGQSAGAADPASRSGDHGGLAVEAHCRRGRRGVLCHSLVHVVLSRSVIVRAVQSGLGSLPR